jgi:integrase/recombinase XerD
MIHPSDDHTHLALPRIAQVPRPSIPGTPSLVFHEHTLVALPDARAQMTRACQAWLQKSVSLETRSNYRRDLEQFMAFNGISDDEVERLAAVTPSHVADWRDHLTARGLANCSISRKLSVIRSLFSYLNSYGLAGANPAHSDYVATPSVPRDGKTVGMSRLHCRQLLDAPSPDSLLGIRDRAMLAILAYTGCRVGELTRLRIGNYKTDGVHKVLEIYGKGGKERRVPLQKEAEERLELWLATLNSGDDRAGPLFRPLAKSRAVSAGFARRPLTRRFVQRLVERLVARVGLDPSVTVHSFRVTALTTARENGCDIVALQGFAGHADPRTTLSYIRTGDRLSKSPAYSLVY